MITNMQPICPLERQGQQCGGPTEDGCGVYRCVNNTCQAVQEPSPCLTAVIPPCHVPICLPGGACGSRPDGGFVNQTCVPGAGQTALPCNHYVCDANGACVGRRNDSMVGEECIPPPDIADQFSTECGKFVCLGDGTCVMKPELTWVNNTCVPDPTAVVDDAACRQFKCDSLGKCSVTSGSVGVGQPCVPANSTALPCRKYVCAAQFDGSTRCEAAIDSLSVGQQCVPLGQPLNECEKAVCAPTGECVPQPDPTRVDTHCTPGPGEVQHDCVYYVCSALGVCNKRVINTTMTTGGPTGHGQVCVPTDNLSLYTNCTLFVCAGNGSCVFDSFKNETGCPGFANKKGGKVGLIVGVAAGAGVIALAIAAVVIFLLVGAGPAASLFSVGGNNAAAARLDQNPLYSEKVASSPAYNPNNI